MGYNCGEVNNSYAKGNISGDRDVGGLVGSNYRGTVSNSYANAIVNGTWQYIGGLVGWNRGGIISNSYAMGNVRGQRDVGGLLGDNNLNGVVKKSYASGIVAGDVRVGGLLGSNNALVSNSYSMTDVTGDTDIGGLAGSNINGDIVNSYAVGKVFGEINVGGLVGSGSGIISSSFWNVDTSGQTTSAGGTELTTNEMKSYYTFMDAGWDFNNTWWMLENITYPLLTWQEISPPIVYIHSPTEGDIYTDKNVSVEWEGTHDILGISHYEIRLNEDDWINVGTDTRYTFDDLEDGEYTVTVKAVDNAGNEAMTSVSFTIDTGTSLLWWVLLVFAVAIAIVLALLFVKKRGLPIRYDRGDK